MLRRYTKVVFPSFSHLKRRSFEMLIAAGILASVFGTAALHGPLRALAALAGAVLVWGSFIEPRILTVKRFEVGKGERALTIAYISDIHVGAYKGASWVRKVVRRANTLKPDAIFLGGDYILDDPASVPMLSPLAGLSAPRGVFAALGNHEFYYGIEPVLAEFAKMRNVTLLRNGSARFEHQGQGFCVAGVDDDWYAETDLEKSVSGAESGDTVLMLVHNPELAKHAAKLKPALMLSGHDHGGQIRLPLIGSVPRMPHHLGRKFDRGQFSMDGVPLIIGQGVGESGPRARLFCPPQIVFVTLRF